MCLVNDVIKKKEIQLPSLDKNIFHEYVEILKMPLTLFNVNMFQVAQLFLQFLD